MIYSDNHLRDITPILLSTPPPAETFSVDAVLTTVPVYYRFDNNHLHTIRIPYSGSGGGGAGSVGGSAGGGSAGNGGLGLQSSINGTATYYAGGGGGHGTSSQGSGGW